MLAITGCSQLLTLRGPARPRIGAELRELGAIENATVLIDGERIVAVGPSNGVKIPAACETMDASGRVVTPGFVDAHTHPVFAGLRTAGFEQRGADGEAFDMSARWSGMRATVRRTRAASEQQLFEIARRHAQWFLRCGTTTIEAKSGLGLTVADELKQLKVIRRLDTEGIIRTVPTFFGASEAPDEYRGRPREYTDLVIREMIPKAAAQKLAEYCDVFCEPGVFGILESRQILQAARTAGLGIRMHVDQLSDSNGAALAAEMGAVTADHLECTDSAGIASLCAARVQPVLLPASVYGIRSQNYADARGMIEAELAIVLATDFNHLSPSTPPMHMVISLAANEMRMTPAESITAATVNAAYSLGRGGQIGSIEPGKLADIVIHDCRDYRELAYLFGVEHPVHTLLGGRVVHSR